jgi:hypothetical protein
MLNGQGLSWLPPLDTGGPPISQYRLYRANGTLGSPIATPTITAFELLGFVPAPVNATLTTRVAFNASSADGSTLLLPMAPNTTYTLAITAESSLSEGLLAGSEAVTGTTRPAVLCPNDCSSHGVCGSALGLCTCDVGYALPDCGQLVGVPVTLRLAGDLPSLNTTLVLRQLATLLRVPSSRIILFTQPRRVSARRLQSTSTSLITLDIIVTFGNGSAPSVAAVVASLVQLAASNSTSYGLDAIGVVSVQPSGTSQPVTIPHVDCGLPIGAANNTCVVCVTPSRPQCGWCAQASMCMQGGVLGPAGTSMSTCPGRSVYVAMNTTTAPWAAAAPSTNVTIAAACPVECPALASCSSCAARPDCAWCQLGGVCVRAADVGAGRSSAVPSSASVCFAVPSPLPSPSPSPGPVPAIPPVWISDPRVGALFKHSGAVCDFDGRLVTRVVKFVCVVVCSPDGQTCPATVCPLLTSCDTCTAMSQCGWCPQTSTCSYGTAFGSLTTTSRCAVGSTNGYAAPAFSTPLSAA